MPSSTSHPGSRDEEEAEMAEKQIQPKRPEGSEPAAGARKVERETAKRTVIKPKRTVIKPKRTTIKPKRTGIKP